MYDVYTGGITDDDAHVFLQPSIDASPSYVFVNCLSSHGQNGGNLQMFSLSEVFSKAGFQTTDGSFVVPGISKIHSNSESSRDPMQPPIRALFTEFPSNPLLRSADLPRLRTLADRYDFLLVVDDTIGNFVNVEVLPYVDIVATSLSKIFSGDANAMGGSLVLNPKGRHYADLKSHMSTYEDTYFDEDALFMERNSRDFAQRVRIIDDNTRVICAFLRSRSVADGAPSAAVKEVFYPKYTTSINYPRCKLPERGYGGLFSLTFTSLAASKAFFDTLPCQKGPSLGTNFTLYGIEEGLVRVSVGMEDRDLLLRSFGIVLTAAESAE
ncbi:Pyridoxal phosphate-dependent transferase [Tylopilus felleus]